MGIVNFVVGRKTKYLVLLFWLIVVVLAGPIASKLSGAEKNEAKSWLPGGAESTKVLDQQKSFRSPNTVSAIVIYERPGGLTDTDRAKVVSDAQRFASVARIDGRIDGPSISADKQAAVVTVPFDLGQNGWSHANTVVKKMRAIASTEPGLSVHITGPAGYASDSASAFKGIDSTLLF